MGLMRFVLLLTALAAGCATVPPPDNSRRDAVLGEFFTAPAAAVLARIPLHYGHVSGYSGVAIGDDAGSRILGYAQGFGNRRQVIMGYRSDDMTLFHEYIHQAHYSGLIDEQLFRERYDILKDDPRYAHIALRWERYLRRVYGRSPALFALLYGRGVTRELIAFLIEGWMMGLYDLPDYMLDVYRPAVRLEARLDSP